MNDKNPFHVISQFGLAVAAVMAMTLTGCVAYVDRPPGGGAYVDAPVVQDDYVYYPNYECYYSVSRHQYAYREGDNWVSRPAPRGVSVNVLLASPSVRMDFHDSPANHHENVVKQYPKNWKPSGANHGPNDKQKDDQRAGNSGR
jgi:hypothetical protein